MANCLHAFSDAECYEKYIAHYTKDFEWKQKSVDLSFTSCLSPALTVVGVQSVLLLQKNKSNFEPQSLNRSNQSSISSEILGYSM